MTNERDDHVGNLIQTALLLQHDHGPLKREVTDAQWADYGRMVDARIKDRQGISEVLCRAVMKATSPREMAAMVQVFILTGTKP